MNTLYVLLLQVNVLSWAFLVLPPICRVSVASWRSTSQTLLHMVWTHTHTDVLHIDTSSSIYHSPCLSHIQVSTLWTGGSVHQRSRVISWHSSCSISASSLCASASSSATEPRGCLTCWTGDTWDGSVSAALNHWMIGRMKGNSVWENIWLTGFFVEIVKMGILLDTDLMMPKKTSQNMLFWMAPNLHDKKTT